MASHKASLLAVAAFALTLLPAQSAFAHPVYHHKAVHHVAGHKVMHRKAASSKVSPAELAKGLKLIHQNDCLTCHTFKMSEPKRLGPSYQAVARKYKGNLSVVPRLAKKVRTGGSGVWGSMPMTPHPQLSKADRTAMVTWIIVRGNK